MIKKIMLVVFVLAIISGGTVFALDKISSSQQKIDEAKRIEQEKEEYKKMEEIAKEDVKNKGAKEVIEITNPEKPNEIRSEWRGTDSLTYKIVAVKNANGTYSGNIIGTNMYDNFIEYNFTFENISQRGFEDLLKK